MTHVSKGEMLKSVPLRCGYLAFAKLQQVEHIALASARAFACEAIPRFQNSDPVQSA